MNYWSIINVLYIIIVQNTVDKYYEKSFSIYQRAHIYFITRLKKPNSGMCYSVLLLNILLFNYEIPYNLQLET